MIIDIKTCQPMGHTFNGYSLAVRHSLGATLVRTDECRQLAVNGLLDGTDGHNRHQSVTKPFITVSQTLTQSNARPLPHAMVCPMADPMAYCRCTQSSLHSTLTSTSDLR